MSALGSKLLKANLRLCMNTFCIQHSKSSPTCTSPKTDRKLATSRSRLFYSWVLCQQVPAYDELKFAWLELPPTHCPRSVAQVYTERILPHGSPSNMKEAKSSLLQDKHYKLLKLMPKHLSPESPHSPGHCSWTCSRAGSWDHLLKTLEVRIGISSKIKFFNFIEH